MAARAYWIMCEDRKRLVEDKKALQDAIKRAMSAEDDEEVERLKKHLVWLENYLRKGERKCLRQ